MFKALSRVINYFTQFFASIYMSAGIKFEVKLFAGQICSI